MKKLWLVGAIIFGMIQLSAAQENYLTWNYCKNITLNTSATGSNVAGNNYNFQILIRLTSTNADIFNSAMSNGEDIRFSRADGSPLAYDIERWDNVNKLAEIWVQVDTVLGNNSTQYIKMYWGKSGITSMADSKAVFDTVIASGWYGYKASWYLNESPSTGTPSILDRSRSVFNGTPTGMTSANLTKGVIANSLSFDGSTSFVTATRPVADSITLGFWMKNTGTPPVVTDSTWYNGTGLVDCSNGATPTTAWGVSLLNYNAGNRIAFGTRAASVNNTLLSTTAISDTNWHYITVVRARLATGVKSIYIDGILSGTNTGSSATSLNGVANVTIGTLQGGAVASSFFKGNIDNIQVEAAVRSADWIMLSYQNQLGGDQGGVQTLVSLGPTTIPLNLNPVNASSYVPANSTLSWGAVPGATGYHIQVTLATDAAFASPIVNASPGTNSYSASLASGTKYIWRVNAVTGAGTGDWSPVNTFKTSTAATTVGWGFYKTITVNTTASNLGAFVKKFPLLVSFSGAAYADVFTNANADGSDIRFTNATGSIAYEFQKESFNQAGQTAVFWVLADSIMANGNSVAMRMYWKNAAATTSTSSGPAVFDTANGFQGVWHLSDTTESTINGYNLTSTSTATLPAATTGFAGGAYNFNGSSMFLRTQDSSATNKLNFGWHSEFTLSVWANLTAVATAKSLVGKSQYQYQIQINGSLGI
jgi:hypothetical protein